MHKTVPLLLPALKVIMGGATDDLLCLLTKPFGQFIEDAKLLADAKILSYDSRKFETGSYTFHSKQQQLHRGSNGLSAASNSHNIL